MMPIGLEKLMSLQYLSNFKVGDCVERKSGKLNELKELNNIRGSLEISGLHLVEEVASEAQEANLKAKRHLSRLGLTWSVGAINKNSDSLQLLDHLCPHQNLKELRVSGYPGVKFSSWLSSEVINIVKIELSYFHSCQHVPPLERLPCLKTLNLVHMEELQCIRCDEISDVFFPSLEILTVEDCKNLRGWQRLRDDNKPDDTCNHLLVPPFPRLSSLEIRSCPNLTCMPPFPHLVEKLKLLSSSMKPLIETCSVQLEPSSLSPLHALRHLEIGEVTGVEAMAEDWMQNLTSLDRLSFNGSSIIQHMLGHLQYLPAQLQELNIIDIEDDKLCLWEYEENNNMRCQTPFHCLRSLQIISFINCKNVKALPEQISDLQSLTLISIEHCPELESLPEAMCSLANLQSLSIDNCPLLLDRCRDESGQDWPKIAHIPNISIR